MLFTYAKEYYVDYLLNPFTIFILIAFTISLYFVSMFIVIMLSLRKKESVSKNEVRIKSVILTLIIYATIFISVKAYRYNTFDKYLVEAKNNLVYTVGTVEFVEQTLSNHKYDTIREYRAEFIFYINGIVYGEYFIVPKDYTNYAYFIKMNIDNIEYTKLIPVHINDLPQSFEVPDSGWKSSPIDSIINSVN